MTRDQFLTEKVLGDYWETCVGLYRDGKKVKDYQEKNPNFSTPEGSSNSGTSARSRSGGKSL